MSRCDPTARFALEGRAGVDSLLFNGSNANEVVDLSANGSGCGSSGMWPALDIVGSEVALDQLRINALASDEVVEASGLQDGTIALSADGGTGDDVLIGSAGADVLLGGKGDDVLLGGPGLDVLDGGPGSNIVIQD